MGSRVGLVHLVQDLTWAIDAPVARVLLDYEDGLNSLCRDAAWSSLCIYDLSRCSGEVVLGIVKAHPLNLVGAIAWRIHTLPAIELSPMVDRPGPATVDREPRAEAQLSDLYGFFVLSQLMAACPTTRRPFGWRPRRSRPSSPFD